MLKKLFNRKQSDTPAIDSNAIPKTCCYDMDGNGRWFKRRECHVPWATVQGRRIKADRYRY